MMRRNRTRGYAAVATAVALALAGCFASSGVKPPGGAGVGLTEAQRVVHLLNRIGYGPRPGDVARVARMGVERYIDLQLHPDRLDDRAAEARLDGIPSLRMGVAEMYAKYPEPARIARTLGLRGKGGAKPKAAMDASDASQTPLDSAKPEQDEQSVRRQVQAYYAERGLQQPQRLLQELQAQKIIRAVTSERQLQEVMTDFWFNHFNIFWGKGADRWLTTDFEMNAIRPHALGKFRDLLMATAQSPAMLFYLDNHLSASPDAKRTERVARAGAEGIEAPRPKARPHARQRGINENYARELMELHTLGVDGGYTQKDVQEVARCLTGWTIEQPYPAEQMAMDGGAGQAGPPRKVGAFVFRERMHDEGEKVVLGQRIPAGGGVRDGERVIDLLARHPSTARFIATELVRRFVSDDPPKSLVDRVAKVYRETDGDIRKMLRTIFTSPAFYAPEAYRAKVKSPFELAVSAVRAVGGETDGSPRLAQFIARMGEPLYQCQPPTGYPDRAAQWVSAGALLERLSFGIALCANCIPGTTVDLKRLTAGADSVRTDGVVGCALATLVGGDVSSRARAAIDGQLRSWTDQGGSVAQPPVDPQTVRAFGLVMGLPEFQRR